MIETFSDREDGPGAHQAFQGWRETHLADGFFLNLRTSNNAMLHRASCPHLGDTDWGPNDPQR